MKVTPGNSQGKGGGPSPSQATELRGRLGSSGLIQLVIFLSRESRGIPGGSLATELAKVAEGDFNLQGIFMLASSISGKRTS